MNILDSDGFRMKDTALHRTVCRIEAMKLNNLMSSVQPEVLTIILAGKTRKKIQVAQWNHFGY